nr:coiled-coil domain-containing protein 151-like [Pelodiscus sinensis]|eukprot:XP_025041279.1 coiled-coil domain-containing protein 151-like [Pelodiscus sinensis]
MQEQRWTAQPQLDAMEAEALRLRHELRGLHAMNAEAQATRDAAKEQLQLREDSLYRERYTRDVKLMELKKQAEERRAQNERVERRVRPEGQGLGPHPGQPLSPPRVGGESRLPAPPLRLMRCLWQSPPLGRVCPFPHPRLPSCGWWGMGGKTLPWARATQSGFRGTHSSLSC